MIKQIVTAFFYGLMHFLKKVLVGKESFYNLEFKYRVVAKPFLPIGGNTMLPLSIPSKKIHFCFRQLELKHIQI